ncbi:hypothetical protein BG015_008109, partial [Linnemannia schmuckeri]
MTPTPTTKATARKAWLASLFLLCLTLSSTTSALPEQTSKAVSFTTQEQSAQDILFYDDGKAYSYCEADHPIVDTYPDPP